MSCSIRRRTVPSGALESDRHVDQGHHLPQTPGRRSCRGRFLRRGPGVDQFPGLRPALGCRRGRASSDRVVTGPDRT